MKYFRKTMLAIVLACIVESTIAVCFIWKYMNSMSRSEYDKKFVLSVVATVLLVYINVFALIWIHKLFSRTTKYDMLTGIFNRDWGLTYGEKLYNKNKLNGHTIIFINIKNFKFINQKISNTKGDLVLRDYAQSINEKIGKDGYIARLGGDNFIIVIKDERQEEILDFCNGMIKKVNHNGYIVTLIINVSAGVCQIASDIPFRESVNRASLSMTRAKEDHISTVYFEKKMLEQIFMEKEILEDCKRALNSGEIVPYYQPKIDANTRKICGAEALARWKKGDKLIPPMEFIPILEREGFITFLDFSILEMVCKDIRDWLDAGITPVRTSVNFSKQHLKNDLFADKIFEIMDRYSVDSKYLEVELTESSGGEDFSRLVNFANRLKEKGIKLAIDDFGTGYSSLSLLKGFNADIIKLDKSFVNSASDDNPKSTCFLTDIIKMIDNQDYIILCEGVEKNEQYEFLRDSGCDVIQGFLFDRPLPHDEFEQRLINADKGY